MKKITNHNILTTFSIISITITLFIEFVYGSNLKLVAQSVITHELWFNYIHALLTFTTLMVTVMMYLKYKVSFNIGLILFMVQTLGVIYQDFHYNLSIGLVVFWHYESQTFEAGLNLWAIFISFLLFITILKLDSRKKINESSIS